MPDYALGAHRRPVSTQTATARTWFDRGLLWAYAFNPEEAVRCFRKALREDSDCAMALWGVAYAAGPNYNKAWIRFDRQDLHSTITEVNDVLAQSRRVAEKATDVEADLLRAIAARFPTTADGLCPEDFATLNIAYAEAMREVYRKYPDDIDVAALFADALLCVSPRALWDLDTGEPVGYGTLEAKDVLETAMNCPEGTQHPALPHLYIHLMEMSPSPEKALPAADRLRTLAPDASHLSHMSTHIDAACGDWRRVIDTHM